MDPTTLIYGGMLGYSVLSKLLGWDKPKKSPYEDIFRKLVEESLTGKTLKGQIFSEAMSLQNTLMGQMGARGISPFKTGATQDITDLVTRRALAEQRRALTESFLNRLRLAGTFAGMGAEDWWRAYQGQQAQLGGMMGSLGQLAQALATYNLYKQLFGKSNSFPTIKPEEEQKYYMGGGMYWGGR